MKMENWSGRLIWSMLLLDFAKISIFAIRLIRRAGGEVKAHDNYPRRPDWSLSRTRLIRIFEGPELRKLIEKSYYYRVETEFCRLFFFFDSHYMLRDIELIFLHRNSSELYLIEFWSKSFMFSVFSSEQPVLLKGAKYACAQWISNFSYYWIWLKNFNFLSFPCHFGTIATIFCPFLQ